MSDLLFHNVYLRGVSILLIPEMVFLIQMIRNRKPGMSIYAALFKLNSLTERGLRAKKRSDVASAAVVTWILVAMLIAAVQV